ncbi:MAG: HAD-IIB family hydrolase [Planctomycetota bacterium]
MHPPWLLISDVDHTVLGASDSTQRLADFVEAHRDRLATCFSSGRFCASILDSVRTTALPMPDILTGGVGTEIQPARDTPFAEAVRAAAKAWADTLNHRWDPAAARGIARALDPITPQPDEFQSPFKQSFYWRNASAQGLDDLRQALADAGLDAKVVYSSGRDLDLLPAAADKGNAAAHLAQHLGYPPERVLVAGDSGNDAALFQHGFQGIVVGNALPELKAAAPNAYHAQSPEGDGVIEGIQHHWQHV